MKAFEPIWGSLIAWYLFLAGLGAAAFVVSAFLGWRYPKAVLMRTLGHILAPAAILIGLVLLMFDAKGGLHNPLKFMLLLTNTGSVMTWGVIFLAGFMVVSVSTFVLDRFKRKVPIFLDCIGVVFGLAVAMYTGALLGVCKTFPLWNNALLPILFLVSALSCGAASILLIGALVYPQEFKGVILLKKVHLCLPLFEIILVASLLFITSSNSSAGFYSVSGLLEGSFAPLFWIGLVAVGLVLPLALEVWMLFFWPGQDEGGLRIRSLSAGCNAGVLVGGFLLRYLVVVAALPLAIAVPL